MADGKRIHVTVITPSHAVYEQDAAAVVAPAFDGALGILPGHAAMLALLGSGRLDITECDGQKRHFAVRGGFIQVGAHSVTILTPEAIEASNLKREQIERELQEALNSDGTGTAKAELKEQRIRWVKAKKQAAMIVER